MQQRIHEKNVHEQATVRKIIRSLKSIFPHERKNGLCEFERFCRFSTTGKAAIQHAGGVMLVVKLLGDRNIEVRQHAGKVLKLCCSFGTENQRIIAEGGGIVLLLHILRDGNFQEKCNAVGVLKLIASRYQSAILAAGALATFVSILGFDKAYLRSDVLSILYSLATNPQNSRSLRESGIISSLLAVMGKHKDAQGFVLPTLNALAASTKNQEAIREAGGIAMLISLLRDTKNTFTQYASTSKTKEQEKAKDGAVCTIASLVTLLERLSVNAKIQVLIREAGGIEILVQLLSHPRDLFGMRGHLACSILGNLAKHDIESQQMIRQLGGVAALQRLLLQSNAKLKTQSTRALIFLGVEVPHEQASAAKKSVPSRTQSSTETAESYKIRLLVQALHEGTSSEKEEAVTALRKYAHYNSENQALIIELGAIGPLVRLLCMSGDIVRDCAIQHCLEAIVQHSPTNQALLAKAAPIGPMVGLLKGGTASEKEHAAFVFQKLSRFVGMLDHIVKAGAIQPLACLLRDGTKTAKKHAVFLLHTLGANRIYIANQATYFKQAGIIDSLVDLLKKSRDLEKIYVASILSNFAVLQEMHVYIVAAGAIDPLIDLLDATGHKDLVCYIIRVLISLARSSSVNRVTMLSSGALEKLTPFYQHRGPIIKRTAERLIALLQPELEQMLLDGSKVSKLQTAGELHLSAKSEHQTLVLDSAVQSHPDLPPSLGIAADSVGGGAPAKEGPPVIPDNAGMIAFSELSYNVDTDFIAAGGFGSVYKATWQGVVVAFKVLQLQTMGGDAIAELQHESAMMTRLRHPNVIEFYGTCMEPGHYGLVMTYMAKGSLFSVLQNQKEKLSWAQRLDISIGLCAGMVFLHGRNILHRDLKSLNVLMDEKNKPKLADFGLSRLKKETATVSTQGGAVGTLAWMAPELLKRGEKYRKPCDVFSLGVILWEMASRQAPWEDAHMPALIPLWLQQGKREDIPAETPEPFAALIAKCWVQKPADRLVVAQVVSELVDIKREMMP